MQTQLHIGKMTLVQSFNFQKVNILTCGIIKNDTHLKIFCLKFIWHNINNIPLLYNNLILIQVEYLLTTEKKIAPKQTFKKSRVTISGKRPTQILVVVTLSFCITLDI